MAMPLDGVRILDWTIFQQGPVATMMLGDLGAEVIRMPRAAAPSSLWNHYQCGDGKWICLAMAQQDRYWTDFCKALGIAEVATDPRFDTMQNR